MSKEVLHRIKANLYPNKLAGAADSYGTYHIEVVTQYCYGNGNVLLKTPCTGTSDKTLTVA